MSAIRHNARKLEKLFTYIEKGGAVSDAARLYGISRMHIYRLIAKRDAEAEAEALNAVDKPPIPGVYNSGNKDYDAELCKNCMWMYFFPLKGNYVKQICSHPCYLELKEKTSKEVDPDPDTLAVLHLAKMPSAKFAATDEQWEEAERTRQSRAASKAKAITPLDFSDLVEE